MTWIGLLFCLLISFLFSGTEAGILSLNRLRIRRLARRKDRAAAQLQELIEQPARLLVTVLVVTSLLNIAALVLLAQKLVGWFGLMGYPITLAVALPLFLFVVELLPKSVFRRLPYSALASVAILLDGVSRILMPVTWLGSWVARKLLRLKRPRQILVAREDLKYVTTEIERTGALSSIERQMIHNVVDFRNVKVRDVMVPLERAVTVQPSTTVEELRELTRKLSTDNFPIVDAGRRALGLVNVFDFIMDRSPSGTAQDHLRRIVIIQTGEQAFAALRRLRASPHNLAAVVDPSGKMVGVVSVEDLLNPLVKVPQIS
jgi:CBS domain containing-hemolysin-like protein